jgi:hypothetical protein
MQFWGVHDRNISVTANRPASYDCKTVRYSPVLSTTFWR